MTPGIILKSIIAALLTRTGKARRSLQRISRGRAGILMYHRILPATGRHPGIEPGMYVCDDTFERHVHFLKENFAIVPLDRILRVANGQAPTDSKPLCVLTFDDGWADFYTHAFPLLKAHQVPATVFLPTDFIGTKKWFWTDRLGFLLLRQHEAGASVNIPNQPESSPAYKILGFSGALEARLDMAISQLKAYPLEKIDQILLELADVLKAEPNPPGRAFLNWEEIREMAASGLVEFGSHTAGHSILTTIGEEAVKEELRKSRVKLLAEKIVAPDFIPFCYPNGNYTRSIARLVRDAGYSLAVSTEYGWNGRRADMFGLKRIPIHDDMTSTQNMFLCRMAGIF